MIPVPQGGGRLETTTGGLPTRPALALDAAFLSVPPRQNITLASLAVIAWRRRTAFALAALLTFVIAALVIFSLKPRYESGALVMVDPRQTNIANVQSVRDTTASVSDLNFVRSQMQILTSDGLARQVVLDMHLQNDPTFVGPPPQTNPLVARGAHMLGFASPAPKPAPHRVEQAVREYLSRLGAFSDGKSFIISLSFTAADPSFAQRALARHLELFQACQVVAKRKVITAAEAWFAGELQSLQAKLLAAEAKQQIFRAGHQLIPTGGETISSRELATITNQLTAARAELDKQEARYRQLTSGNGSTSGLDTGGQSSELLQRLREQESLANQRLAQLEQVNGAQYPAVAMAKSSLAAVQAHIAQQSQRLTASAASDVTIAQSAVHRLEAALADAGQRVSAVSQDELVATQIDRDIDADRRLYDDLLLRSKQVSIQGQLQEPDTLVVSPPSLPLSPAFPHRFMLLAVAAMASTVLGTLAAFASDILHAGTTTAMDATAAACGLTGLAVIPKLSKAELRQAVPRPGSHLAASLQTLQNSITFRSGGRRPRVTVFVSALPGEGKTLLATLYARSQVTLGVQGRVLLIDTDMRRLRNSKATTNGLQGVLKGQAIAECIVPDIVSGLDILPSVADGKLDPGTIFSAGNVQGLLHATSHYEAVIIDTPPIGVVDDALHLVAAADASVLVARWNRTSMASIQHALQRIAMTGAQVAGMVLTAADMRKYRSGADSPGNFIRRRAYYVS